MFWHPDLKGACAKGRTQCRELPLCAGSREGCQWQVLPSPVQCEETATQTRDLPVTGGKTLPLAPGPPFKFHEEMLKYILQRLLQINWGFYNYPICLQSNSGYHITFLSKKDTPIYPSDSRPIFLLNCSVKLLTKLTESNYEALFAWTYQSHRFIEITVFFNHNKLPSASTIFTVSRTWPLIRVSGAEKFEV